MNNVIDIELELNPEKADEYIRQLECYIRTTKIEYETKQTLLSMLTDLHDYIWSI